MTLAELIPDPDTRAWLMEVYRANRPWPRSWPGRCMRGC